MTEQTRPSRGSNCEPLRGSGLIHGITPQACKEFTLQVVDRHAAPGMKLLLPIVERSGEALPSRTGDLKQLCKTRGR